MSTIRRPLAVSAFLSLTICLPAIAAAPAQAVRTAKDANVADAFVGANRDESRWTIGTKTVQATFSLEGGRLRLASYVNKLTEPARDYVDPASFVDLLSQVNSMYPERYAVEQVWSKTVTNRATADPASDSLQLPVKQGDMIGFAAGKCDQGGVDWDTKVDYGDGESYLSSDDKSLAQGPIWHYFLHVDGTGFMDQLSSLEGDAKSKLRVPLGGSYYYPTWSQPVSANGTSLHSTNYRAVRVWKATKHGRVRVSGLAKAQGGAPVDVRVLRIKEKTAESIPANAAGSQWRSQRAAASRVMVGGRHAVQLDWTLASITTEGLIVCLHVQAYPGTSILRHWVEVRNEGPKAANPAFFPQIFSAGLRANDSEPLVHSWMVGGNNGDDQGMLKSAEVAKSYRQGVGSHAQFTYAPWMAVHRKNGDRDGWFVEVDCTSMWHMAVHRENGGSLNFSAGAPDLHFARTIPPGGQVKLPLVTLGVFRDDLDDMGRRIYDWQYAYLWDYTRHDWYGRMLYAAPIYGMNTGTASNQENFTRRLWQDAFYADTARKLGFDVLWDDAGWYAQAGWWNTDREGPDFAETVRYLTKSGMKWTLWFLSHPSSELMDAKVGSWGNFKWRTDGVAMYSLKEDHKFRGRVERFLNNHPQASFHTCAGGGTYAHTFEIQRYADANYFADFGGDQTNYYFSYIDTPDKWFDSLLPGLQNLAGKDRRLLTMVPVWGAGGVNGDGSDLAPVTDLYRYLSATGVAGRWSYVAHPVVKGDEEHQYFQRVSHDGMRSIIILKHRPKGEVAIYPRGLLAKQPYLVEFEKLHEKRTRTGSDLMAHGIVLKDLEAGELVYLNLPNRPRSGRDKTLPAAPGRALARRESNMGYAGIGIYWSPGTDENWISSYEVRRGGRVLERVGTGTYYFDRSDGWDAKADYAVRTVDGDGNVSPWTQAVAIAHEPLAFSALGGHSSRSGLNGWQAESATNGHDFSAMTWVPPGKLTPVWIDVAKEPGGAEGYWQAAGTARVGHGWQQASATAACARTWVAPQSGTVRVAGRAVKDRYHQNKGGPLRVRILRNNVPVWPTNGWTEVPGSATAGAATDAKAKVESRDSISVPALVAQGNSLSAGSQSGTNGVAHDLTLDVKAGDAIRFVLDRGTTPEHDYLAWTPNIAYAGSPGDSGAPSTVRILCGAGEGYTDKCGNVWSSDRFWSGGKPVSSKLKIEGATPTLQDEKLYQCGRAGRDFSYSIPVKPGLYSLRLKFAESECRTVFERPFDLSVNGRRVLRNFDICQAAGKPGKALEQVLHYLVPDSGGLILLRFRGGWDPDQKTDAAMVQAIEILPEDKPRIRIDAGSDAAFVDWNGAIWSRDAGFVGGRTVRSDSAVTQASPTLYDQELYRTARTGRCFRYDISAPPGLYTVHLKFAELWLKETGKRPMNIEIGGLLVRESWDPGRAAGEFAAAADIRVEDVAPDKDGKIRIAVSAVAENEAILQGIEIE